MALNVIGYRLLAQDALRTCDLVSGVIAHVVRNAKKSDNE